MVVELADADIGFVDRAVRMFWLLAESPITTLKLIDDSQNTMCKFLV